MSPVAVAVDPEHLGQIAEEDAGRAVGLVAEVVVPKQERHLLGLP